MIKPIKRLFFHNFMLKVTALILALVVWAVLVGRERTDSERAVKIQVELINIPENIEIRSVRPEEVQVRLLGAANRLDKLDSKSLSLRIDLKDMKETSKQIFYSEAHISKPKELTLLSCHPKLIEVQLESIVKEVPVRVLFSGKLPRQLVLRETRINPERTVVVGGRSQLADLTHIWTEAIDLSALNATMTRRVALQSGKSMIHFKSIKEVEVTLIIEKINEHKDNKKNGPI